MLNGIRPQTNLNQQQQSLSQQQQQAINFAAKLKNEAAMQQMMQTSLNEQQQQHYMDRYKLKMPNIRLIIKCHFQKQYGAFATATMHRQFDNFNKCYRHSFWHFKYAWKQ